jgi:hypothetical protein
MLGRGAKDKEHAMSQTFNAAVSVVGIDIGKNSFHIVGHDERGAIVLRQKWSRGQVEARFANIPPSSSRSRRTFAYVPHVQTLCQFRMVFAART